MVNLAHQKNKPTDLGQLICGFNETQGCHNLMSSRLANVDFIFENVLSTKTSDDDQVTNS